MKQERTLVLLKPDAVQRNLVGEIVSRFERVGLKIVGLKFIAPDKERAYKHYVKDENEIEALGKRSIEGKKKAGMDVDDDPKELGQEIIDRLIVFLTSGPVVAIVLEGHGAIKIVRKLVGSTEPLNADVGTIRADFTLDSYTIADGDGRAVRNLIHASSDEREASYEVDLWFGEDEIVSYRNVRETVLYDAEWK